MHSLDLVTHYPQIRRSRIATQQPDGFADGAALGMVDQTPTDTGDEPRPYQEAMTRVDFSRWIEAMEEEFISIEQKDVWSLQDIPRGSETIATRWVWI